MEKEKIHEKRITGEVLLSRDQSQNLIKDFEHSPSDKSCSGGRRFSFSVALIAGDKKGSVGLGLGKAGDTALAINKAVRNAKRNMVKLKLTKTMSIPHELSAKFSSAKIVLMPNHGRGLVAGSVVRDIVKLSGMKDITGKILSKSKNKLNNAKAVMLAFSTISSKYTKPLADNVVATPEEIIIPQVEK